MNGTATTATVVSNRTCDGGCQTIATRTAYRTSICICKLKTISACTASAAAAARRVGRNVIARATRIALADCATAPCDWATASAAT